MTPLFVRSDVVNKRVFLKTSFPPLCIKYVDLNALASERQVQRDRLQSAKRQKILNNTVVSPNSVHTSLLSCWLYYNTHFVKI